MKTISKVLSALLLSGHSLFAVAQGTTPTDITLLDNAIYMASGTEVEIGSDGSATVSICMKNSVRTTGYQFDLYLPEDLAATPTVAKSKVRKEEEYSMTSARQADGAIRVVGYCSDGNAYEGNDGEIATIKFSSVQEGTYSFTFAGMEITTGGISYPISGEIVSNVTFKAKSEEEDPTEDTDISQFEKILYVPTATCYLGSQKTLYIHMKNDVDITAFMCDLHLPDGITIAKDSNGKNLISLVSDRKSDTHSLTSHILEDGTVALACLSLASEPFYGNDGAIVSITVDVANNMEPGDYALILDNMEMTTPNTQRFPIEKCKSTISVVSWVPGDVNNDNLITISDAVGIVNFVVRANTEGLNRQAADANEDGSITISDAVYVVNKVVRNNK